MHATPYLQGWEEDPDAAIEFFKNELEKAEKQHDEDFGATMKDYEAKMKVNPKMAEYYEKVKAKLSEECELKKAKARQQYGAKIEQIQNALPCAPPVRRCAENLTSTGLPGVSTTPMLLQCEKPRKPVPSGTWVRV